MKAIFSAILSILFLIFSILNACMYRQVMLSVLYLFACVKTYVACLLSVSLPNLILPHTQYTHTHSEIQFKSLILEKRYTLTLILNPHC